MPADTSALQALQDRLEALEIKASFAEDTVEQLNQVIIRQQDELDWLRQQVSQLRAQMPEPGAGTMSPQHELPPHY
jgi:SlyX protein